MHYDELIERYVRTAPPYIARSFQPDCCIGATRITVGVLGRLGIPVRAQPTRLFVYTKNLWERVEN